MALLYLGLSTVGWRMMVNSWWDKLVASILLASTILVSLYALYRVYCKVKRYWQDRHQQMVIPGPVARYLDRLRTNSKPIRLRTQSAEEVQTFGVFLGSFATPPTPSQARLLSQWDVLIVDPYQQGVLDALSTYHSTSSHTLGRLDVSTIVESEWSSNNEKVIQSIELIDEVLATLFRAQNNMEAPFTGVLLVDAQKCFQPVVLNEIIRYINNLGLDVWLEMSPPTYLSEGQCRKINMQLIRGTVCRNGTIRPDGDRQNYHQMNEMRIAMRAIAAQRVVHGPPILLWETIDEGAEMQYAVVQRSYNWCRYNSALLWIAPAAALTDAEAAITRSVRDKPLGALMWLKGDDNMKAHGVWRTNDQISLTSRDNEALYASLHSFVPGLASKLRLSSPPDNVKDEHSRALLCPDLPSHVDGHERTDPLSTSAAGDDFTGLGCFHLGLEVEPVSFAELVRAQHNLADLDLLQRVTDEELDDFVEQIEALHDSPDSSVLSPVTFQAIEDLLNLLTHNDARSPRLHVYVGLHSGFQTGSETQFWGLYELDHISGALNIYLSGRTQDRAGVILHTYLSSRGCTRTECFAAEQALSKRAGSLSTTWGLPQRIVHDLEQLSPAETLLFLRRLVASMPEDGFGLLAGMRAICNYQLIEVPTFAQLRALSSNAYLNGEISPESLVTARLAWLRERGCWLPETSSAVSVFKEVDARLHQVLMDGQSELYEQLSTVVQQLMQHNKIDAGADIFALSVFCAFRKLALNEIELEVLDRNCFPNHATDQAACFAENFALGSRCDEFFDMTPRALGRILSQRYRAYYMVHQPPSREEGFTDLPTAYAAMQVDLDPEDGQQKIPAYYQITFLGIFAVPALIDIGCLTTIGRGLYLTTFMTSTEKTMATTALMLALLACGAIGSWISSGGCYYLYANAFSAMNMFVLTRFVAGIAIVLIGGSAGLVAAIFTSGVTAGLVFFFYFAMLSIYLSVLAALSIYQFPGSDFQSGRNIVMTTIPILFISPITTLWVQHDTIVYPCVLTLFLGTLLFRARRVMSAWSTWYLNIPCVTDAEVLSWYVKTHGTNLGPEEMRTIEMGPQPRKELHAAVLKECGRHFWAKRTADPLVAKLAEGYTSTTFLMSWYCKFKRTRMPLAYSATWNLTLKAGLENMMNMQKGLKLHSAFLHWRHTGSDIWSAVLYFIVALLDKWAALLSGGALVGLSAAGSAEYRLAVGFGLCYYLIGAVSLDYVSQPLWTAANENTTQPITSLKFLRQATVNDRTARRRLYWVSLMKFFFLHLSGILITSALMWVFEAARNATGLFLAYVGAYTGLLWYQYNKIYCGNEAAKSLATAAVVGLPAGIAMHKLLPQFAFSGVIALSIGTWTACFHSMSVAKIGWPTFGRSKLSGETNREEDDGLDEAPPSYSCSTLDPYPELSQSTLSKTFESVCDLPAEERFVLDPSVHPGARVLEILTFQTNSTRSEILQAAFPSAEQMVREIAALWASGKTVVELVTARHLDQQLPTLRTVSRKSGDLLHILVFFGSESIGDRRTLDVHRDQKFIAEAVMQATLEHKFGVCHNHSLLGELLAVNVAGGPEGIIPEGIKRHLEMSKAERTRLITGGEKRLLRDLLLGLDCDVEWDDLPKPIRFFLMNRVCGKFDHLSATEEDWVRSRICADDNIGPAGYIARYNLGMALTANATIFAKQLDADGVYNSVDSALSDQKYERLLPPSIAHQPYSGLGSLQLQLSQIYQKWKICIKFLVLSLTADPEYQRELDYTIRGKPLFVHWPVTFFLNGVWSFCKALQGLILPLVFLHGRENIAKLYSNLKGMKTILEKDKIILESLSGISTCFFDFQPDGSSRLSQYAGRHVQEPSDAKKLMAINTYTDKLRLRQREEYLNGDVTNSFTYEYRHEAKSSASNLPLQRHCLKGDLTGQIVQYDERGYITTGSTFRGINPVKFRYWYRRNAKFDDELVRGEYVLPHITIRVFWSMPSRHSPNKLDEWVPFAKVTEAIFIQGSDIYHATWGFEHKFHPEVSTTLNGHPIATPAMISEDWFHVLKKPEACGFLNDNPLLSFSAAKSGFVSRLLGLNVKRYPISTSHARTQLWKSWKEGKNLDAVTARWLDERLLRQDSVLSSYWRNRDFGRLQTAKDCLDSQADTIMARVDVDPDISSWVHVAFKISDLYSFGQGGDSRINTRTLSTQLRDMDDELHVLAMDTSTWPNEPGGVSACRRDLVNDLTTIKWHVLAESANDYGVPRFQIEKNVQSLTILPLWGLDFLNPTHGVFQNSLDSAVVQRSFDTRKADIEKNFLPILTSLVRCSRTLNLKRQHIQEATNALVDLNAYFESSRNWNDVWNSDIVKQTWRELWLTEDQEDTLPISQWWDFEKPTIQQLDQALNLWHRYLFIFSIPVPEKIPDVFQASHHFTGATYGILCKVKRQCQLHVWDHCISFREFTTFMSSAVSFDSPFVNSSLISLSHLSCVLLEHHADVVLPCAAYFNPGWEVELGSAEGALEHRRTFKRKIDPVVNGICNMEKFEPIKKIKTEKPTVVMLSHIQFVKDIKNAIMATDLIVNKWGFKDYTLHIYGDMERAAGHSTECQELIASKGLREHCILGGLANPSVVLQDAWLFLNSSISEGLPLAMGEAALTGVPVVCTDVGASFCVVTDAKTGDRFSEVVPPNDAESLARAQISVLALLGRWSAHAQDTPGMSPPVLGYPHPSTEQVQQITHRMYAKTEQRRALGMLGRSNVLKNFSSERYLREHEQMLWIGKYRSHKYQLRNSTPTSSAPSSIRFTKGEKSSLTSSASTLYMEPRLTPDSWLELPAHKHSKRASKSIFGMVVHTRELGSAPQTPRSESELWYSGGTTPERRSESRTSSRLGRFSRPSSAASLRYPLHKGNVNEISAIESLGQRRLGDSELVLRAPQALSLARVSRRLERLEEERCSRGARVCFSETEEGLSRPTYHRANASDSSMDTSSTEEAEEGQARSVEVTAVIPRKRPVYYKRLTQDVLQPDSILPREEGEQV